MISDTTDIMSICGMLSSVLFIIFGEFVSKKWNEKILMMKINKSYPS
jgi:hypothetical protein